MRTTASVRPSAVRALLQQRFGRSIVDVVPVAAAPAAVVEIGGGRVVPLKIGDVPVVAVSADLDDIADLDPAPRREPVAVLHGQVIAQDRSDPMVGVPAFVAASAAGGSPDARRVFLAGRSVVVNGAGGRQPTAARTPPLIPARVRRGLRVRMPPGKRVLAHPAQPPPAARPRRVARAQMPQQPMGRRREDREEDNAEAEHRPRIVQQPLHSIDCALRRSQNP